MSRIAVTMRQCTLCNLQPAISKPRGNRGPVMCFVLGQHYDGTRSCELLFLIRFHHVALFDVFEYLPAVHIVNRTIGTQL